MFGVVCLGILNGSGLVFFFVEGLILEYFKLLIEVFLVILGVFFLEKNVFEIVEKVLVDGLRYFDVSFFIEEEIDLFLFKVFGYIVLGVVLCLVFSLREG